MPAGALRCGSPRCGRCLQGMVRTPCSSRRRAARSSCTLVSHTAAVHRRSRIRSAVCRARSSMMCSTLDMMFSIPREGTVLSRRSSTCIALYHARTAQSRIRYTCAATCRGRSIRSHICGTRTWAFHARSGLCCICGNMKQAARAHTAAPHSRRSSPFACYVRRRWLASTRGIGSVVGHARRRCWGCSLGTVRACVHACKNGQGCRPHSSRYACCARIASQPSSQAASPRGPQGPS